MGPRTPTLQKLKFKDKLTGKSTDELLKKLKALHLELSSMEQDTVDTKSLSVIKDELLKSTILLHKDRGVKAYAACSMVDMLRLYAPEAPYTLDQLQDLFDFILRQLSSGLKIPDTPYLNEYAYILESLATVKSICLVAELSNHEMLTREFFSVFFALLDAKVKVEFPQKVEESMAAILIALVEESPTVPKEVLDLLLSQFTEREARKNSRAFRLAADVCNTASDRLQRDVASHFAEIILQHDEEDLEAIQAAHQLIMRIHAACPPLLNIVIPQLEEELGLDNTTLRVLATETLGDMYAVGSGELLARKYASTWKAWINRTKDKSAAVRIAFVEKCKHLIAQSNSLTKEIEAALGSKLLDQDEKVRAATCALYSRLDYETALNQVSLAQLKEIAQRILDKKASVRQEAFKTLGKLYRLAYSEIEANDPAAIEQFAWIPREILITATRPSDAQVRLSAERTFSVYILPSPSKVETTTEATWTEKLLVVLRHLDSQGLAAFLNVSNIHTIRPSITEIYVQCCVAYNGGVIDENEKEVTTRFNQVVQQMSKRFSNPAKAAEDLEKFGTLNETRLYKLLTSCLDPQVDLKTLVQNSAEFLKRIDKSAHDIRETMADLLRRGSLRYVNRSSIPTLVKRIARKESFPSDAHAAEKVLAYIAKHCPIMFKSYAGELTKALADDSNESLISTSLCALAALTRSGEGATTSDKRTITRALSFLEMWNVHYAKSATRLLCHVANNENLSEQVAEHIVSSLDTDDESLEAKLIAMAELARAAPEAFEEKSNIIIAFLLKEVLSMPTPEDEQDDPEEWAEGSAAPYTARLKILALKICVKRSIANAHQEEALMLARPVANLLFAILDGQGVYKADMKDKESPLIRARLRLQAGLSLLKLATIHAFKPLLTPRFIDLVMVVQDPSYQVRHAFLLKLIKDLQARKLEPRFHIILFFTALDPDDENRAMARAYVTSGIQRLPPPLRLANFEMILPRLIHATAVDPGFSLEPDRVKDAADYLEMYVDLVLTADNIHLLHLLAQKVKSVRLETQTQSHLLYAVGELAQYKIRQKALRHSWTTNSYPGKISMPGDIFKPLPNADTAKEILKTQFLSDELLAVVSEPKPAPTKPKQPRKRKSPGAATPKRSRVKRRKKEYETSSEEDESDDDKEEEKDEADTKHGSSDAEEDGATAKSDVEMEDPDASDGDEEKTPIRRGAPRKAKAPLKKQKRRAK